MGPLAALVILVVAAATYAVVVAVRARTPRTRLAAAHARARRLDLRLDPELEDVVALRLARREVAGVVAALVVVGAVAGRLLVGGLPDSVGPVLIWLVLADFLGHAIGLAAVGWWESARPAPPGPRVARPTEVTIADYVAPIERRGLWVAAAVALGVAAMPVLLRGAGALDPGPVADGTLLLAAVVPLGAVGLVELASRAVLAQRQVAATPLALAWDDALRSIALRDIVTFGIMTVVLAPLALLSHLSDNLEGGWPGNAALGVVLGLTLLLLLALAATALVAVIQQPQRWFRRRLWPDPVERAS